MNKPNRDPDRIGELEDALRAAERQLAEVKTERDAANDLVDRMRQNIEDANALTESWIESFNMQLDDNGMWSFEEDLSADYDELLIQYRDLLRNWNKNVGEFNATIAPKPPGRPLNASDAQCVEVLKLRKRKISLRDIADETSLALSTVRTIIDRDAGTDRSTINRLEKLDPQNARFIAAKARKQTRDSLPDRINKMLEDSAALAKEARGLGRGKS
jgi:hypothetical protein